MNRFLPLVLSAALCAPAFGQQWRIAPTVGVTGSKISFSNAYLNAIGSNSSRTTFGLAARWQVGALIDYAASDRVSIRSGLFYSTRGSALRMSATQAGYIINATGTYQMSYLDLPLLVTVAVGDNGFRLVGGPVLGFALGGTGRTDAFTVANYTYRGEEFDFSVGSGITDSLLPTDLSFSFGALKQVDLNGRFLELGLHVQPSLSSFAPTTQRNASYTATYVQFGLKASYFFDLSRY